MSSRRKRLLEGRKTAARRDGSLINEEEKKEDWQAKRDPITDKAGNNWMCLSFLAPKGANQKADHVFIKMRGAFPTLDEANAHADLLRSMDDAFDIWVCSMYEWGRVPPSDKIEAEKPATYAQKELNDVMQNYYLQRREQAEDIRKRQEMATKRARDVAKEKAKRLGKTFEEPTFDKAMVEAQSKMLQDAKPHQPDPDKSVEALEKLVGEAEKQLVRVEEKK